MARCCCRGGRRRWPFPAGRLQANSPRARKGREIDGQHCRRNTLPWSSVASAELRRWLGPGTMTANLELPDPTLRLGVDADALTHNWRALDRLSGHARAGAAIKADAYGLGVDKVAPILRAAGVDQYYVAHWSEVPALLQHVPASQIAVLHGPMRPPDADYARAVGVRPGINSLHQARVWAEAGGGLCDLMVDTGINRLGLPTTDLGDPLVAALEIDTLMSHLASADEDEAQNAQQAA